MMQKQPYINPDNEVKIVPPPLSGWDAISPLSAMDPKFGVILDNFVPRPGFVEIRGGYNAWVQGLNSASPVETLMVYRPVSGNQKMFACAGSTISDVSTNGSATTVQTGRATDRNQYVNFTPAGGSSYILLVNGSDPYTAFDGTTWTQPVITGVTGSTLINITATKRRIWFVQKNSANAYYLATDAIQGAVSSFPVGALMTRGGNLVFIGNWTVDGGDGPDDYTVFLTDQGQAILYKGTDPSNANTWALVGVFDLPNVIGNRPTVKIGSDLGIITLQGLLPLSQALPFDPSGVRSVALTNRIQNAMQQAAQLYYANFGWEAITFPLESLLILNIPTQTNSSQIQYVMNMQTGAWCSFSGWAANTFAVFNNSLFFGDNKGNVNLAYTASLDLVTPITATMKCAFNYFDDPGRIKNMKMVRPLIVADGQITPTLGVDVDFGNSALTAAVTILTPSGGVWDTALWDTASWSTGAITVNNWLSVTALGTALAVKMLVNVQGSGGGSGVSNSVFDTGVFDTMVFDGNGSTVASGTNLLTLQINSFEALMEFGSPI